MLVEFLNPRFFIILSKQGSKYYLITHLRLKAKLFDELISLISENNISSHILSVENSLLFKLAQDAFKGSYKSYSMMIKNMSVLRLIFLINSAIAPVLKRAYTSINSAKIQIIFFYILSDYLVFLESSWLEQMKSRAQERKDQIVSRTKMCFIYQVVQIYRKL